MPVPRGSYYIPSKPALCLGEVFKEMHFHYMTRWMQTPPPKNIVPLILIDLPLLIIMSREKDLKRNTSIQIHVSLWDGRS